MKKTYLVVTLLILAIFISGCSIQSTNKSPNTGSVVKEVEEITSLKMGLIPADDAEEMLKNYEPIRTYLEEEMGMPVEILVTTDYSAAIEAMRAGHIDMAWFGPFSYVIASNIAEAQAIVNGVKSSTGSSTYKSVIVVNVESGIETLEDLKGEKFAFVDPASTSGNLIPRKMLLENGIDPDEDFEEIIYSGTHNAVQYAIANGHINAGATGDNVYYRMIEEGEIDPEINKIIYESEPIPGSPIAVRGDLPESIKLAIQNALLNMNEQTIHKVDGWGGISNYQKVTDSDYDVIRTTAKLLGMDVTSPEAANK